MMMGETEDNVVLPSASETLVDWSIQAPLFNFGLPTVSLSHWSNKTHLSTSVGSSIRFNRCFTCSLKIVVSRPVQGLRTFNRLLPCFLVVGLITMKISSLLGVSYRLKASALDSPCRSWNAISQRSKSAMGTLTFLSKVCHPLVFLLNPVEM